MKTIQTASHSYFLAILSNVLLLLSFIFINKSYSLFSSPPFTVTIFILPFWFILNCIIAETYGEKFAQRMFIYSIINSGIFIFIALFFVSLPTPYFSLQGKSYQWVFSRQTLYYWAFIVAILAGNYSNLLAERYVKFTMKLRYMWMRSMISSALGQFVFVVVMGIITSYQDPSAILIKELAQDSFIMFGILIVMTGLLTYPASLIIAILQENSNPASKRFKN